MSLVVIARGYVARRDRGCGISDRDKKGSTTRDLLVLLLERPRQYISPSSGVEGEISSTPKIGRDSARQRLHASCYETMRFSRFTVDVAPLRDSVTLWTTVDRSAP